MLVVLVAAAAGLSARGQAAEDVLAAPRLTYQAAWSADQRKLEEAVQSLHGRFVTTLERVQEDARTRGDLDEALAARQLAEEVLLLASNPVFRAGAGIAQVYKLPDPPTSGVLTPAGYTSYVARVDALLAGYNIAASNRHAAYLAALDQLVRDETRKNALESAVKVRDERTARAAEGPSRIVLASQTPPPAAPEVEPAGDFSLAHAALGRWRHPSGGLRILKADRSVECFDREGNGEGGARILPINPRVVDVRFDDGHFARYTLAGDDVVEVVSRANNGELRRFRMTREGEATAPEPPVVAAGSPPSAPSAQKGFEGRWRFKDDQFAVRVFNPDGTAQYLLANGTVAKQATFFKIDETEAEVAAADGWIDSYKLQPDGTLTLEATHAQHGTTKSVGRRVAGAGR